MAIENKAQVDIAILRFLTKLATPDWNINWEYYNARNKDQKLVGYLFEDRIL